MALVQKDCESVCPKCGQTENGNNEIEWGLKDYADGGQIFQPAHCNACGCNFKEWYSYDQTEYED